VQGHQYVVVSISLREQKESKISGNMSKIMQQSFRRVIILVARIYLAHDSVHCLTERNGSLPSGFNLEMYPILKRAFDCLETRLQKICDSSSSVTEKPKSAIELLQSIESDICVAKQRLAWAESATSQALESLKRSEVHYLEADVEARVEKCVECLLNYATEKSKKQKNGM
jgi:hypothetical protein